MKVDKKITAIVFCLILFFGTAPLAGLIDFRGFFETKASAKIYGLETHA